MGRFNKKCHVTNKKYNPENGGELLTLAACFILSIASAFTAALPAILVMVILCFSKKFYEGFFGFLRNVSLLISLICILSYTAAIGVETALFFAGDVDLHSFSSFVKLALFG